MNIQNMLQYKENDTVDWHNPLVKVALRAIHGDICWYCNKELEDMTIDHIIPRNTVNDEEKYKRLLLENNLESSLNINCIRNLAPICGRCNSERLKKGDIPPKYIEKVKKNSRLVSKINRKLKYLQENCTKEDALAMLKELATQSKNPSLFLEKIGSELFRIETVKKQEKTITRGLKDTYIFNESEEKVGIYGFIIGDSIGDISCSIEISKIGLKDILIAMSNNMILNNLFESRRYGRLSTDRKYIIGKDNANQYLIELGHVRVFVTEDKLNKLGKLIDSFSNSYLEYMNNIEKQMQITNFKMTRYTNRIKLFSIKKVLWIKILHFVRDHNCYDGESEWNLFLPSYNKVIIVDTRNESRWNTYSTVQGEYDWGNMDCVYDSGEWIQVTWQLYQDNKLEHCEASYCGKEKWTAFYTMKWLVEELIPYVLYCDDYQKESLKFLKKHKDYITFKQEQYNLSNYVKFDLVDQCLFTYDVISLKQNINCIISYLSIHEIYLTKEEYLMVIQTIKICIDYINHIRIETYEDKELIDDMGKLMKEKREEYCQSKIGQMKLQDIFVFYELIIEKVGTDMRKQDIQSIMDNLKSIFIYYNEEQLLSKYKNIM